MLNFIFNMYMYMKYCKKKVILHKSQKKSNYQQKLTFVVYVYKKHITKETHEVY